MKLYRFVVKEEKKNIGYILGQENEAYNLNEHGVMSPSYPYFKTMPKFSKKPNTFEIESVMSKYFFSSLAEALIFARSEYLYKSSQGKHYNYTMMEIDIPDELVAPYIGTGFYYVKNDIYIEYRIPYKILYEHLAQGKDPNIERLLDYYNEHLLVENLDETAEYQQFMTSAVPKVRDISMKNCISIYPLFCFTPSNLKILCEDATIWLNLAGKLASEQRSERLNNMSYMSEVKRIIGYEGPNCEYDANFNRNDLYHFTEDILRKENEELKRAL